MDDLDGRLLELFAHEPRIGVLEASRQLGVARGTVQARLDKGAASGYEFLFAEQRGKAVGYACFGRNTLTVSSFDLYWIAVDRSRQGQGIGRLLLEEVERQVAAAGGTRIYIETSHRADYQATRGFYERCGYRLEAVLADLTIPYCVASSGDHEKIRLTLSATGLLPRFEGRIFSVFDVARPKPAPDVFLFAAETLGVAPSACAVIEDTPTGIRAAVAAGMCAFGFAASTPSAKLEAAGTHFIFSDMTQLPALLHAAPPCGTQDPHQRA